MFIDKICVHILYRLFILQDELQLLIFFNRHVDILQQICNRETLVVNNFSHVHITQFSAGSKEIYEIHLQPLHRNSEITLIGS